MPMRVFYDVLAAITNKSFHRRSMLLRCRGFQKHSRLASPLMNVVLYDSNEIIRCLLG